MSPGVSLCTRLIGELFENPDSFFRPIGRDKEMIMVERGHGINAHPGSRKTIGYDSHEADGIKRRVDV